MHDMTKIITKSWYSHLTLNGRLPFSGLKLFQVFAWRTWERVHWNRLDELFPKMIARSKSENKWKMKMFFKIPFSAIYYLRWSSVNMHGITKIIAQSWRAFYFIQTLFEMIIGKNAFYYKNHGRQALFCCWCNIWAWIKPTRKKYTRRYVEHVILGYA